MKIKYEGMKATRKYLTVYGRLEHGGAIRFVSIPIPVTQLDAGALEDSLDAKVRLDLLAIWSAERGDDVPMF